MKMSEFYKSEISKIDNSFQIIYPMKGIELLFKRHSNEIQEYLKKILPLCAGFSESVYQIIIIWSDGNDIMTDIWLYKGLESGESGYIIDCRTFRGLKEVHEEGITASDGLILLGKETELAEEYRRNNTKITEYIEGERPNIGTSESY